MRMEERKRLLEEAIRREETEINGIDFRIQNDFDTSVGCDSRLMQKLGKHEMNILKYKHELMLMNDLSENK